MVQPGCDEEDQLERSRDRHVGRLLLRAHRAFSVRAVDKLRQRGYDRLTLAHINLLPHLAAEGTRITLLAERAGMTKQGAGQLVADLALQGYVTREADSADRRATLVRFTPRGRRLLGEAVAVVAEVEAEYATALGDRRLAELRDALETLAKVKR